MDKDQHLNNKKLNLDIQLLESNNYLKENHIETTYDHQIHDKGPQQIKFKAQQIQNLQSNENLQENQHLESFPISPTNQDESQNLQDFHNYEEENQQSIIQFQAEEEKNSQNQKPSSFYLKNQKKQKLQKKQQKSNTYSKKSTLQNIEQYNNVQVNTFNDFQTENALQTEVKDKNQQNIISNKLQKSNNNSQKQNNQQENQQDITKNNSKTKTFTNEIKNNEQNQQNKDILLVKPQLQLNLISDFNDFDDDNNNYEIRSNTNKEKQTNGGFQNNQIQNIKSNMGETSPNTERYQMIIKKDEIIDDKQNIKRPKTISGKSPKTPRSIQRRYDQSKTQGPLNQQKNNCIKQSPPTTSETTRTSIFRKNVSETIHIIKQNKSQNQNQNEIFKNMQRKGVILDKNIAKQKNKDNAYNIQQQLLNNEITLPVYLKAMRFVKQLKQHGCFWSKKLLSSTVLRIINDKVYYKEGQNLRQKSISTQKMNNLIKKKIQDGRNNSLKFNINNGVMNLINVLNKKKREKVPLTYKQKRRQYMIKQFTKNFGIFDPANDFLVFWDIIQFFTILFSTFHLTIQWVVFSSWSDIYGETLWKTLISFNIGVFIIDIMLQFNLGYYERGLKIMNHKQILLRYLKWDIWMDILSLIPLFQVFNNTGSNTWFEIMILVKVPQLYNILNKYADLLSMKNNTLSSILIKLYKLFFSILLTAHFLGCLFLGLHIIVKRNKLAEQTWLQKYDDSELIWFESYSYALYWAVTTMTSVGYGDITPANPYEVIFVTFTMFIACVTFAYTFNLIGTLFENINRNKTEFNSQMKILNRYLEQKNINKTLQMEVRKSLEYLNLAREKSINDKEEQLILALMSEEMKTKLKISANMQYLNNLKLFKETFSTEFLEKLSLYIEPLSLMNQEIIYQQGDYDQDEQNLYFIEQGQMEICIPLYNQPDEWKKLVTISKNEPFGEYEFFLDTNRTIMMRSKGTSYLLKLNRKHFLKLLHKYPLDYQKYCYLKDKIIHRQSQPKLKTRCQVCMQEGHLIETCYKFHFIPDREQVLLKDKQTFDQERLRYKRRDFREVGYLEFLDLIEADIDNVLYSLEPWEKEKLDKLYPTDEEIDEDNYYSDQSFSSCSSIQDIRQNQQLKLLDSIKKKNKKYHRNNQIIKKDKGKIAQIQEYITHLEDNYYKQNVFNSKKNTIHHQNSHPHQIIRQSNSVYLNNSYHQNKNLYSNNIQKNDYLNVISNKVSRNASQNSLEETPPLKQENKFFQRIRNKKDSGNTYIRSGNVIPLIQSNEQLQNMNESQDKMSLSSQNNKKISYIRMGQTQSTGGNMNINNNNSQININKSNPVIGENQQKSLITLLRNAQNSYQLAKKDSFGKKSILKQGYRFDDNKMSETQKLVARLCSKNIINNKQKQKLGIHNNHGNNNQMFNSQQSNNILYDLQSIINKDKYLFYQDMDIIKFKGYQFYYTQFNIENVLLEPEKYANKMRRDTHYHLYYREIKQIQNNSSQSPYKINHEYIKKQQQLQDQENRTKRVFNQFQVTSPYKNPQSFYNTPVRYNKYHF